MARELDAKKLIELKEAIKAQRGKLKDMENELHIATFDARNAELECLREHADLAHTLFCNYNHTDGCGWGYERDNWQASTHRAWLEKVENVCKTLDCTHDELWKFLSDYEVVKKNTKQASRFFYFLNRP